jgi:hypothetical protein
MVLGQCRNQLPRPLSQPQPAQKQSDDGRVYLNFGLDQPGAIATPRDLRMKGVDPFKGEVEGNGLCIGLAPPIPIHGDRVRARHGYLHKDPGSDDEDPNHGGPVSGCLEQDGRPLIAGIVTQGRNSF